MRKTKKKKLFWLLMFIVLYVLSVAIVIDSDDYVAAEKSPICEEYNNLKVLYDSIPLPTPEIPTAKEEQKETVVKEESIKKKIKKAADKKEDKEILTSHKEEEIEIKENEKEAKEDLEQESIQSFSIPTSYKVNGRSIEYITQEEFNFLVSIVSAESRGEPFEGQVAVVDVILNRVDAEWYPDTITGVITQEGQFESYWAGHYKTAPHTESVIKAVFYALENITLPKDVVFFRADYYHSWGTPYTVIGNHYFSK